MWGMAFPQLPTISTNGNRNRHKRAVCSKSLQHVVALNPNSDPLGSCCQSWTELIRMDRPDMFHIAENNTLTKAYRSRLRKTGEIGKPRQRLLWTMLEWELARLEPKTAAHKLLARWLGAWKELQVGSCLLMPLGTLSSLLCRFLEHLEDLSFW